MYKSKLELFHALLCKLLFAPVLTGLADPQRVLGGVEHLILILFIDDFALAQVWGEFGRIEDACELVPHPLHAIPELLASFF